MTPLRLSIAVTVATLGLAAPASGAGANWYVDQGGAGLACTSAQPCVAIATAVGNASNDDTIHIGPGTYTVPVNTAKRLTFSGAGPGSATSTNPATDTFLDIPGDGSMPALKLRGGGAVMHMRLRGQFKSGSTPSGGDAVQLAPDPGPNGLTYVVDDVVAIGGQNILPGAGVAVYNSAAPTRVFSASINGGVMQSGDDAVRIAARTADVAVTGTLLDGGLSADPVATATVRDVHGIAGGAFVSLGHLVIERSRFENTFAALFVWGRSGGTGRATVRDSVFATVNTQPFQASGEDAAVQLLGGDNAGEDSVLTAIGSTFYATGSKMHAALSALRAYDRLGNVGVQLTNTVARLPGADGVNTADLLGITATTNQAGNVTIEADHSAFSSVLASGLATVPAPGSTSNVAGDPLFASTPSGTLTGMDLSLQDGSPLVDRGDPAVPTAGELDVAGIERSLDGDGSCTAAPDIGAFERPAKACTPPPPPLTPPLLAPAPQADHVKPVLSRLRVAGRRATFTLSEAARVTATIERARSGRRAGKRCVAKRRRGKRCTRWVRERTTSLTAVAGVNALALKKLPRGRHRIRLVAVDAAGNASAPVSASFTVKR